MCVSIRTYRTSSDPGSNLGCSVQRVLYWVPDGPFLDHYFRRSASGSTARSAVATYLSLLKRMVMNKTARTRFRSRRGVLTLEWILLVTIFVIGIIGGLAAVRDAVNSELQDLSSAITSLNITPEAESEAEGVINDGISGR